MLGNFDDVRGKQRNKIGRSRNNLFCVLSDVKLHPIALVLSPCHCTNEGLMVVMG